MDLLRIDKRLKRPVFCVQQEFMRHLVKIVGVDNATIWHVGPKAYYLSARVRNKPDQWFIGTRREPQTPRTFKRVEIAVRVGKTLFRTKEFKLIAK